jgi:hypothetical protein
MEHRDAVDQGPVAAARIPEHCLATDQAPWAEWTIPASGPAMLLSRSWRTSMRPGAWAGVTSTVPLEPGAGGWPGPEGACELAGSEGVEPFFGFVDPMTGRQRFTSTAYCTFADSGLPYPTGRQKSLAPPDHLDS